MISSLITVMTFNTQEEGSGRGLSGARKIAHYVSTLNIDIVALQEINEGSGPDFGSLVLEQLRKNDHVWSLGTRYIEINNNTYTCILTRFPVKADLAQGLTIIQLPNDIELAVQNVHLNDDPYEAAEIEKFSGTSPINATDQKLIHIIEHGAYLNRGKIVQSLIQRMQSYPHQILLGDFNEPSHFDWSIREARKELIPCVVQWPCSQILSKNGFLDTYRTIYPNVRENLGYTWSLHKSEIRSDRIDYIYVKGSFDIVDSFLRVDPNLSDHTMVVTRLKVREPGSYLKTLLWFLGFLVFLYYLGK